jgi:hypothetical protein
VDDGQAEAGPLAHVLRREERIEDSRQDVRSDPFAFVGDAEDRHLHFFLRPEVDRAALAHRVDRVGEQVAHDLLDLGAVDVRERGPAFARERDAGASGHRPEEVGGLERDRAEIRSLSAGTAAAGEIEEAPDDPGHPLGLLLDHARGGLRVLAGRPPGGDQARPAGDDVQRRTELVGEAGGEAPDRRQAVGVAEQRQGLAAELGLGRELLLHEVDQEDEEDVEPELAEDVPDDEGERRARADHDVDRQGEDDAEEREAVTRESAAEPDPDPNRDEVDDREDGLRRRQGVEHAGDERDRDRCRQGPASIEPEEEGALEPARARALLGAVREADRVHAQGAFVAATRSRSSFRQRVLRSSPSVRAATVRLPFEASRTCWMYRRSISSSVTSSPGSSGSGTRDWGRYFRIFSGKSSTVTWSQVASATARSITPWSSRTLPGQS